MSTRRARATFALALGATLVVGVGLAPAAQPKKYSNCKALNAVYAHGVGKKGAKDKTSDEPVTNFRVNAKVYDLNRKALDRDKDGIACEKG